MTFFPPIRLALSAVLLLAAVVAAPAMHAQGHPVIVRPAPAPRLKTNGRGIRADQHLGAWMESHSNLSIAEQQRELELLPGFHDLPPQTQQRLRERLIQLNNMPPGEREQLLRRTEALERLTPQQQLQVSGAMNQYSALPKARRQFVGRVLGRLRAMPPAQRQEYLNSIQGQFSPQERTALNNLLAVEPYLPQQ